MECLGAPLNGKLNVEGICLKIHIFLSAFSSARYKMILLCLSVRP